jgi:hypothetical protein
MTEGKPAAALDERLRHEINNAMMIVLSFVQVIEQQAGENPVVHDAIGKIKDAVGRSSIAVTHVSRELGEIAARLSAR